MAGILLSDDLIFTSRIVGTARALGLDVRAVRTIAELEERRQQLALRCVILDLNHPELRIEDLAPSLKGAGVRIVGYGSHVAVEVLKGAREAGCDVVWPRSKFAEELENALPEWLAV